MGKYINDGRSEQWTGSVVVEGLGCEVTLTIDVVALINDLGEKAALSAGNKAVVHGGSVKVSIAPAAHRIVRARYKARRVAALAKRKAEDNARRAERDARARADGYEST